MHRLQESIASLGSLGVAIARRWVSMFFFQNAPPPTRSARSNKRGRKHIRCKRNARRAEEQRRLREEEARRAEEQRRLREEEARRRAEEQRRLREEEARRAEEQRRADEEEEARWRADAKRDENRIMQERLDKAKRTNPQFFTMSPIEHVKSMRSSIRKAEHNAFGSAFHGVHPTLPRRPKMPLHRWAGTKRAPLTDAR
jgi:hypothetical protein